MQRTHWRPACWPSSATGTLSSWSSLELRALRYSGQVSEIDCCLLPPAVWLAWSAYSSANLAERGLASGVVPGHANLFLALDLNDLAIMDHHFDRAVFDTGDGSQDFLLDARRYRAVCRSLRVVIGHGRGYLTLYI